ncbi:hypothetical protein ACWKSP_26600 [Micromonosporaceae bacterium Da 78-11]
MAEDNWISVFCQGGPLDGRQATIRPADGFLAADKAAGKAWMYRRDGQTFRVCTDHDDSLTYPQGARTGERVIDWERLPLTADPLQVIALGDSPESLAGDPIDDGWAQT